MQFATPENLWFLLALVPMTLVYVGYWVWKERKKATLGDHPLIEAMSASSSARLQIARAALVLVSVTLLVVASARPQWGQINRPIKRMGVDVVFALDLSRSMLARDATPNRLQAAKDEITTTMQLLSGDRVGLVVFTAVSFAQSPLTTDYGAIHFYLEKLDPVQMPMGGTSVGRAMQDAIDLLEAHAEEADAAENRVIVLITDGEDHESDPIDAARLARDKGIHVVTVGIGSESGAKIPIVNADGSIAGFKRDRQGDLVRTKLDSSTLKKIAEITNGEYIHYSGQNSVANGVVEYVNRLEKSELESLMRERYEDRFLWFTIPALLLLLIALALGERRRVKPRGGASVALVLLLAFTLSCDRPFERHQDDVAEANRLVDQGKFEEALDLYDRAQSKIPTTPELSYNRGRALLGLERWEEAQQAFARALETNDPSLLFNAHANLGLALAGEEQWEEAYEAFRAALRVAGSHPDAIDRERIVKTRKDLEIAFRKLYPPCSNLEDDREEDDEPGQAAQLEGGKAEDLTLCGFDDDWFVVPAIPGTTVSVETTFEDLRDKPDPEQIFMKKPSDVQVALLASDGETVLAVDQGERVPESRRTTRSISRFLVEPEMVADGEGVFVKVRAAESLEFSYDIDITSIPPCHALQEASEPNDAPGQAASLPTDAGPDAPVTGHLCAEDEDRYSFDVEMGDALFFDVQAQRDEETGEPPRIEIDLWDTQTGELIAQGTPEAGLHTVGRRVFQTGRTVQLRVRGATPDQQGPYTITPYHYAPCVIGDDRYEENDDPMSARELDPSVPIHRYLRLCNSDPDFYRFPFPEDPDDATNDRGAQAADAGTDAGTEKADGELKLGLALISIPPADRVARDDAFTFDVMSPSGDQILREGVAPENAPPDPNDDEESSDAPPTMPLARVLMAGDLEGDSALVRVAGASDFYHLVQLDPRQPPSPEEEEQQQEDQEDQGDEGEQEEKEKEEGDSGEEEDAEEEEAGDEGEEERGDEGEDEQKKEEEAKDKPGESAEQEEEEEQKKEEGEPARAADPRQKRAEEILEALEQSDDNFQMKKALEKVPGRFIEKDW